MLKGELEKELDELEVENQELYTKLSASKSEVVRLKTQVERMQGQLRATELTNARLTGYTERVVQSDNATLSLDAGAHECDVVKFSVPR